MDQPETEYAETINVPEVARIPEKMTIERPIVKTTAVDWLQISLTQPMAETVKTERGARLNDEMEPKIFKPRKDSFERGNFVAVPNFEVRDRIYSMAFDIYWRGSKFALVYAVPHANHIKPPDAISCKILNEWLYMDWLPVAKEFFADFNLQMTGISRMDIAIDGFNMLKPLELYDRGILRLKRFQKINRWAYSNSPVSGFMIGSRKSDRYCRGYHKNKEIEQSSKKHYIQKFWTKNGVNPDQHEKMERIEVVLKSKELQKFCIQYDESGEPVRVRDIDLHFLEMIGSKKTGSHALEHIISTALDDLYAFTEQKKNEKTNVSRLKRVAEIVYRGTYERLTRVMVKTAQKIRSTQMAVKCLYQLHLKTGYANFKYTAQELIEECELNHWFKKRKAQFEYEWQLAKKKGEQFYPLYHSGGANFNLFSIAGAMDPGE